MKLMDKIRSHDARERDARDARQRAARAHLAQEPVAPAPLAQEPERQRGALSTADLAATETQPMDVRGADATRDDLAHARAARDEPRSVPAGRLRDADVEDAVDLSRRQARAGESDGRAGIDARAGDMSGSEARVADMRAADSRSTDARGAASPHRPQASPDQPLAPLFSADVAQGFRSRWDATQIGFVDDPRQAVQQADELVAQVMKSLAQSFADERRQLEAQMKDGASTENLRVALQRYRSFFQRLLTL